MSPALLFSLPIPFLCMTQNNSTDHGPGRSRWSTFATLHVRFQCNGRLCRRRASQESQFVNMIKNDGFEDGSLPLRSAGSQRSFENPTVPTYRSLTGLWFQSIIVAPLQPSLNTPTHHDDFTTLDIDHAHGWASEALTPSPYHPSGVVNLNGFDEDWTHELRVYSTALYPTEPLNHINII